MLNLAEMLKATATAADTGEDLGQVEEILLDNATRKCLLKTAHGLFAVEKVALKNSVLKVLGAVQQEDISHFAAAHALHPAQEVFDTNGIALGKLADVTFSQRPTPKSFCVGEKEFPFSQIAAVGDVVLVKEKSQRMPRKRALPTPPVAADLPQETPAEMPPETPAERQAIGTKTPARTPLQGQSANPNRHYGDFGFLIGKKTDKSIVNFLGEVMIKQGEIITKEVLRQAKISGKLVELYLHAD